MTKTMSRLFRAAFSAVVVIVVAACSSNDASTYIASANNIGNTVTTAGVQNLANVLANTTGSIYAGSPRAFMTGRKA